jgi:hypothetical protein
MKNTYKKILLSIVLYWGFLNYTIAQQSQTNKKFYSGILIGLNTSQITGDDLAGYDKPSFTFGAFVKRKFGEHFSMLMELSYLPKGSRKNTSPKDSIPTFYSLKLRYIEIPVLVQYTVKSKLTLEVGPSVGVLLSYTEEDIFGDLTGIYSSREQFKRYDLSFNAGINYSFTDNLSFSLRSANSMFPVRNHDQQTKFRLNQGQYSSCIMGRLIYNF